MTREQAAIKLDIDGTLPPLLTIIQMVRRAGYEPLAMNARRSPSGKGWHVVFHVTPRPRSPYEVIALQAILGGDLYREAIQMNRARSFFKVPRWMRDMWNVLYLSHPHRIRHLKLERKK